MTLIYGRGPMGSGPRSLQVGPQVRRFWAEQDGTREAACGRHRHPASGSPRHEQATSVAVNPSSVLVSIILSELDSVRQVIDNLISNAVKYTETGGRVGLRLQATEDTAVVTVTDTGIGIAPEDIERLFDPFFRAGRARESMSSGLGPG